MNPTGTQSFPNSRPLGFGQDGTQEEMTSSANSDQLNQTRAPAVHEKHSYHGYRYPPKQMTSSSDSKISPVKHQRRKLRQKLRKEQLMEQNQLYKRTRKISSTSNDESNDDFSASESLSSDNDTSPVQRRTVSKKTYL